MKKKRVGTIILLSSLAAVGILAYKIKKDVDEMNMIEEQLAKNSIYKMKKQASELTNKIIYKDETFKDKCKACLEILSR